MKNVKVVSKFIFLNRSLLEDAENYHCESVHNLKDHQCVAQLNTQCENVGKICKKKCSKDKEYLCQTNNLSKMKCDVNRGVCESTNRCILQSRGTFRKSDKSADKCGKRNIFFVSNKHRMFNSSFYYTLMF